MPRSLGRRLLLKFFAATATTLGAEAALGGCTSTPTSGDGGPTPTDGGSTHSDGDFDYIVVGSGAGGGPLAANLARQGYSVLLLEAGTDQGNNKHYQVPAFHTLSTDDPAMRWDYFVQHYENPTRPDDKVVTSRPYGEQRILYPRAGTLGGCTAHNAMITVLPHARDWDDIAQLVGDSRWSAVKMRRYYEVLEHCAYMPPGTVGHGFNGWLNTERPDSNIALKDLKIVATILGATHAFSNTGGIPSDVVKNIEQLRELLKADINIDDPARDSTLGLFSIPHATEGHRRTGPREYIVKTAQQFPNLTVKTNSLVSRVLFEQGQSALRASGVEVLDGEHLYAADPAYSPAAQPQAKKTYTARHEIILSAGAFNTPQLLKLSGIGPQDELAKLNIELKHHLPGVGTNLQDRYEVGVVSKFKPTLLNPDRVSDLDIIQGCTFGQGNDPCYEQWQQGLGPYTSNGAVAGIVTRSHFALTPEPDLFVFGLIGNFKGYYPGYSADTTGDHEHLTWAVLKAHTGNRQGYVKLRSADPRDTPIINFRYFHEGTREVPGTALDPAEADLNAMVEGLAFARNIGVRINELLPLNTFEEEYPGPAAASPHDFVRDNAWGHHASCTCPIGKDDDPNAVLDAELRVRGTANLRVVDASVFPKIPGIFIVSAIYMVSELATDLIIEKRGESRRF